MRSVPPACTAAAVARSLQPRCKVAVRNDAGTGWGGSAGKLEWLSAWVPVVRGYAVAAAPPPPTPVLTLGRAGDLQDFGTRSDRLDPKDYLSAEARAGVRRTPGAEISSR